MRQLVVQDVAKFLVGATERNDDPLLEYLGETAHTFADERRDDVRLLEVVVRVIQEDRDTFLNLVGQLVRNLNIR